MTDDRRDERSLVRQLPGLAPWPAPHTVQLSEDERHLVYVWSTPDFAPERVIEPGPRMLDPFLRLTTATPRRIADYAQRWGHLGLGMEGLPGHWGHTKKEAIADWRRWAAEAGAVVRAGNGTAHGLGVSAEDREALKHVDPDIRWPRNRKINDALVDSGNVARFVNRWIALGAVRLEFQWDVSDETPTYVVRTPCLFGALALAIAAALNGSETTATCTNCGQLYFPKRKPQRGRRNYCPSPECSKRAAWRDAKRTERSQ